MDGTAQDVQRAGPFLTVERVAGVLLALVCLAALLQVIDSYPASFFPRFWDEGIYTGEAATPGAILAPFSPERVKYGAMKLGYALPLRGAFLLFGPSGFMYLSTAAWLISIMIVGVTIYRRIGKLEGWFAGAVLAYSSLYGKYLAEAGPTLVAASVLCGLWATYEWRRSWITGPCLGLLALVDPKWLLPAGLAIVLIECLVECTRGWRERAGFLAGVAFFSVSVLGAGVLLHPPYWSYVTDYALRHAKAGGFEPSLIFAYYLAIFGAGPVVILGAIGVLSSPFRRFLSQHADGRARRTIFQAALFSAIPLLFYSLFGPIKGLRFFAAPFPLLVVPVTGGVVCLLQLVRDRFETRTPRRARLAGVVSVLALAGLVVIPSEGPARHLRLPTGIPDGMASIAREFGQEGTISSYIWPVVYTRWGGETEIPPFAPWGLLPSDQWLILVPMLDRVTIESRLLVGEEALDLEAEWRLQQRVLQDVSDSLFSFPAQFYSSDYHLCEQTVLGIGVLRRWRALSQVTDSSATVYRIDRQKSQMHFGWK